MATNTSEKTKQVGRVTQVVGVVVDIDFSADALPRINNALEVEINKTKIVLEVAQHLSESSVRAIALSSTDGLARGTEVIDTGQPIVMPIGKKTLGRMFNVTGQPIDHMDNKFDKFAPIHRNPPFL